MPRDSLEDHSHPLHRIGVRSLCPEKPRKKKREWGGREWGGRERQIERQRTVLCPVAIKSGVELQNVVPWLLVYGALQPLGCDAFLMGR